jgi:elongation factor P hydroxylase
MCPQARSPLLSASAAYTFTTSPSTLSTPIPSESMLFGRHFGLGPGLSERDLVEMSANVPQARSPLLSASAAYTSTNSHPIPPPIIPSESMHFGRHFGLGPGLSGHDLVESSADVPQARSPLLSASAAYTSTNSHPIPPPIILSESMHFGHHFGVTFALSGRDLVESSADVPQARSLLLSASAAYKFTTSPSTLSMPIPSESIHFGRHFGLGLGLSGGDLVEMSADVPACAPPPTSAPALPTPPPIHLLPYRCLYCQKACSFTIGGFPLHPVSVCLLFAFCFCLNSYLRGQLLWVHEGFTRSEFGTALTHNFHSSSRFCS